MYKCILSCPLNQDPQIPFSSSHRYHVAVTSSNSSLSAYATTKDRQFFELTVTDTLPEQQSTLDANLDKIDSFEQEALREVGIPELAFTYLTLAEYNPIVPELLDAWIDDKNQQEVIIINTSDNATPINTYIPESKMEIITVVSILQMIAKLWKSMSKLDCCQTLLHLDNLKISTDETLVLDKIYFESKPLAIKEIATSWTSLISHLDDSDDKSSLLKLVANVEAEKINNIKQLRDKLQLISQEIQLQSILEEQDVGIEFEIMPEDEEFNTIAEQLDYDEDSLEESEATQINQEVDEQPTVVLPMKLLSIKDVGMTDIGKRRGHNEDCFAIETKIHKQETSRGTNVNAKGLFIVCDGMGGHASGEVASAMAVKHLRNYFHEHWDNQLPEIETIREGVLLANEVIHSLNMQKGQTGSGRMGTTLVMALIHDNQVAIAHVGDSRAYKITRKSGLELLTTDHCVAQTEIKQGVSRDIAYGRPDAFQLTQALGPRDNSFVYPEISFFNIKEDTLLLMCSDGLYDNDLLENNYKQLLLPLISSSSDLDDGVGKIIDLGNQINGHDNITCLLVRIKVQPNLENQMPLF